MANLEALRQLKRVVKAAPADRLHMRHTDDETACGTVHCVWGWARIDPWFKARGDDSYRSAANILKMKLESAEVLFASEPGYTPLMQLLDTNPHAITKKMVLTNIDLLIAGKRPRSYLAMINEAKRSKKSAPSGTSSDRRR